jgi:hypothetical protein
MRERLAAIKIEASNRQVARVLNVPKGTIDSSLFALKRKWDLYDPRDSDDEDDDAVE